MTGLRPAGPQDVPALADLWHRAWHEAHDPLVPPLLVEARSRASFARRLGPLLEGIRLSEDAGGPRGFCAVTTGGGGELDQLFLAPRARGTGLAARLLGDGEARLALAGCIRPRLRVIPGNARALAFYRREGWTESGRAPMTVSLHFGSCTFDTVILEKSVADGAPRAENTG